MSELPRIQRLATLGVLVLLQVGCLSPRPDGTIHLVLAPPPAGTVAEAGLPSSVEGLLLGVGPVILPAYLDRPQLVSRPRATELTVDAHARWSAPLGTLFAEALAAHLLAQTSPRQVVVYPWPVREVPYRSVRLTVLQLEQVGGSEAVLRVRWEVVDRDHQPLGPVRLSEHRTPVGSPPGDIALALSELVERLAQDVAAALRSGTGSR